MEHDFTTIYKRADGSYVIDNGKYHVPSTGMWEDLWKQVDEYATAHPEALQEEPSNDLTDEQKAEVAFAVKTGLEARLSALEDALVELMGGAE